MEGDDVRSFRRPPRCWRSLGRCHRLEEFVYGLHRDLDVSGMGWVLALFCVYGRRFAGISATCLDGSEDGSVKLKASKSQHAGKRVRAEIWSLGLVGVAVLDWRCKTVRGHSDVPAPRARRPADDATVDATRQQARFTRPLHEFWQFWVLLSLLSKSEATPDTNITG